MGMAYFDELVGYTGHCGSLFNKKEMGWACFHFPHSFFFDTYTKNDPTREKVKTYDIYNHALS